MPWRGAGLLLALAVLLVAVLAATHRPDRGEATSALPSEALQALDHYISGQEYQVTSVQVATEPENFGSVCSFFDAEQVNTLWCVATSGGYPQFSHYVLHQYQDSWTVVPLFDFDSQVFMDIGCDNW